MSDLRLPGHLDSDRVLPFRLETQDVRGRVVRLGEALEAILATHSYPFPVACLLAEALTLAALVGSVMKGEGQLTLQARATGPVRMLVCDYTVAGAIRGYADYDDKAIAALPAEPLLEQLFGADGYLALTLDPGGDTERYQGIVPLAGADLAQAARAYFEASEQIPTAVRLAVRHDGLSGSWMAGGLLIQHLPEGEEGGIRLEVRRDEDEDGWRRADILASSVTYEELTDPTLELEAVLYRLFHEDGVRVFASRTLSRGCRCTRERLLAVLAQFPQGDLDDMIEADGQVHMVCAFCSRDFPFGLSDLSYS